VQIANERPVPFEAQFGMLAEFQVASPPCPAELELLGASQGTLWFGESIMLKKLVYGSLFAGLVAIGLVTTGVWSYVRTGVNVASESVRDSVPIEWEIKRARQMIEDLKPEIAKNMQIVAKEEVSVQRLSEEITSKQTLLTKSREDILRLKDDLKSGAVRFVYAGRNYTQEQVRDDLSNRFKQFQVHEQTTNKLNQILVAREKNLDAARRKLDEMLSAKRELEVEIENLQARMTMVQVAQTSNPISIDDSHLSGTRQLLDEIRSRIDVAERLAASEGSISGNIQLDEVETSDVVQEIADYFGEGRSEVETLVSNQSL
jgi:chromosome segregation ATPase